jgi:hypothetical protein
MSHTESDSTIYGGGRRNKKSYKKHGKLKGKYYVRKT